MSIQQSTELIIFVTHVEAEDAYLKIWGQVDKNSATCVERMILPLAEHFARNQGCSETQVANLRPNALCCARFQNEGYYRGRILNIRPDGMVVIQFIDYGNIEVLLPQEIHLLENTPGTESLQSFPPVAFDFVLMYALPINGIWESKIIESIKKTLCYNECKILIHSLIGNQRFIKLWYNNEDFSELLVKRNMAVAATLQDMFGMKYQQQMPIYQPPNKRITNSTAHSAPNTILNPVHTERNTIHGYHQNVPPCCANQKHLGQSSVQEALVFKSRVLDVGSKHDVYVSFVEDGPQKFSVQVQSTSQILSMLMRDINSHPLEPLREPPLPGSVCLGRYTVDKVVCRAVVMSVMEEKCKLYYVDFGHTEVLPYTDIFQLPPHYINPKVLSIRFTLSGVKELHVTNEMKEYFKKIVSGKLLVLHVRPPEGPPLVQYGDLYDNGKNIKDILRQAFPTPVIVPVLSPVITYHEPQKLLKGAEEIIHVSFVESCRRFFVQLDSNVKALEAIMNCLAEFCKTAPMLNPMQIGVGFPCAALYENQWYRAQILNVKGNNVKVLYVDYGNEETISAISLRVIHDDLVRKLQAQAIKCALHGWEVLQLTEQVSNQFEQLILEKQLRMRVIDVHSDCISVDLYDPNMMENIKSHLLYATTSDKTVSAMANSSIESHLGTTDNIKVSQSDDTNKWHKKSQLDSWQQPQNDTIIQEKHKSKAWKDEYKEEKRPENKSNFYRLETRMERINKDDFSNGIRNTKDTWSIKQDQNEAATFNKSCKGNRTDKSRMSGNSLKIGQPSASRKSWSDKDSDASSKSSGRRGRGNVSRGGYSKRDGTPGKLSNNKWNDKESGKMGSDFNRGSRFKEKRGQGYRLTQCKLTAAAAFNSTNAETGRRNSPMRGMNQFRIPTANVTIGAIKSCEIVFTNNPTDFYIQIFPDYTALDEMMEQIASMHENGSGEWMKANDIKMGTYCIARYSEDSKWYRALIKSVEKDVAIVQFIDYGNTDTVKFQNIRTINEEFMKIPIQAIHCKLFGLENVNSNSNETKTFVEKTCGKVLEVEFLTVHNGLYNVLLRDTVNGSPVDSYINEEFNKGVDLMKAKEEMMIKKKTSTSVKQSARIEYASVDMRWATTSYEPGDKRSVIVTWFTNPSNFYCQIVDRENEFRTMMNEIQKVYAARGPVSYTLEIGSPVIAIFADDRALYRAEIIELNKSNGHIVKYIDFGNTAIVPAQKIYPVEKKFMYFPKQAIQCSLKDIIPQDGLSWANKNTAAIEACFNADKYECTFHDFKDSTYVISLMDNGKDVANLLIEKNLASLITSQTDVAKQNVTVKTIAPHDVQRLEINLLNGQTLRVRVSNVESTEKFYIQLPSAAECERIIDEYMSNKDARVMQRLSSREMCLGIGCLVYTKGIWRRAVISNGSRSAGFEVKFIDTGACDEIQPDRILALPGELSVMQNQAIECTLRDIKSSPDLNEKLKGLVQEKEVIVCIEEVNDTRLTVKLFDLFGNKITIADEVDEKICPICPMPILSSTHKVFVSFMEHSANIWLQCAVENNLLENLHQSLEQYYSTSPRTTELKVGSLCIAKCADGYCYRAKILNYTENRALVNLIDYGHNEEIQSDALVALDSEFYQPHQLSINVSLLVTLNCSISEQFNILKNYVLNKELTAIFRNVNKKWVVELIHGGEKLSDRFLQLNNEMQQQNTVTEKCTIQNLSPGCKYNMYVSHVDSPSQFWLQCVDEAPLLSAKQEELQTQASTFPIINGILEEGTLCAAVYSIDNLWYRAQVLDADEDITTVRFIDYGNTDVINNISGNIRKLPVAWTEKNEYAIKCRLDVIPVDTEDWNEVICEKFENLIKSTESVQALIIANSVPKRVDLFINNKSVSETLVEDNHGIMVQTEEELFDEIVDLVLDPHSAFVSHINSPSEFWVQEEKSVGDLEVMSDRFMVADLFPKVEEVKEGLLCVAKYPEDDQWYRAQVVSHTNENTKVLYIDYGNSAVSTEIRSIPADLADVPPLSRKCCLAMPEGITDWSEKACSEFVKLAADGATIFLLDVLKEDDISLVKLTFNDQNVAELLGEYCDRYPSIIEERLPPLGEENSPNVVITCIDSPDKFWIQTQSNISDLETMADRLHAASSYLLLNNFETGTICAAKYNEKKQWCRAKILSHSEIGTEVLFIDYGHATTVDETRVLPQDIINIPALSRCCMLQKPETVESWSSEACEKFKELAADGVTMFQFKILDSNDPVLVKLSLNDTNVSDILISVHGHKLPEKSVIENEVVAQESTGVVDEHTDTKEDSFGSQITNSRFTQETAGNELTIIDHSSKQDRNQDSDKTITELTVDEIIRNMEQNTPEDSDEPEGLRISTNLMHENKPVESSDQRKYDKEYSDEPEDFQISSSFTHENDSVEYSDGRKDDNKNSDKLQGLKMFASVSHENNPVECSDERKDDEENSDESGLQVSTSFTYESNPVERLDESKSGEKDSDESELQISTSFTHESNLLECSNQRINDAEMTIDISKTSEVQDNAQTNADRQVTCVEQQSDTCNESKIFLEANENKALEDREAAVNYENAALPIDAKQDSCKVQGETREDLA